MQTMASGSSTIILFHLLLLIFLVGGISAETNITFYPDLVKDFYVKDETTVQFNITTDMSSMFRTTSYSVTAKTTDEIIAIVVANNTQLIEKLNEEDGQYKGEITIRGKRLGRSDIEFYIHETDTAPAEEHLIQDNQLRVIVLRKRGILDQIYRYTIIIMACMLYVGFGCKIDLQIIKEILKKPIAPAIGLASQFVIMPLLGFGLGQILKLETALAFGLLTLACSPGGGSSNIYVNLFNGNLDLSLTMTTISTFASLAMMPLWLYALGHFYINTSDLSIPYWDIVQSILTIIAPTLIGLIIKYFAPKVADKFVFGSRILSAIFIAFLIGFGSYVNLYMYQIMGTKVMVIPAAILLSCLGYALGFLLAKISCRDNATAATISIETGVQNATIPIIILQGNFPQPEGDVAAVMPVAAAIFYNVPIMIALFVYFCYRWRHPKPKDEDSEEANNNNDDKTLQEDDQKGKIDTTTSNNNNDITTDDITLENVNKGFEQNTEYL